MGNKFLYGCALILAFAAGIHFKPKQQITVTVEWAEDVAPEVSKVKIKGLDSVVIEHRNNGTEPTTFYHKMVINPNQY